MSRRRRKAPAGFFAPAPRTETGFVRATYDTTCAAPDCGEPIRRGEAIVPRRGGGYQHPQHASGADDR